MQESNVWARRKGGLSILNPFPLQRKPTKELGNNQKQHCLRKCSRLREASRANGSLERTKSCAEQHLKGTSTYASFTDVPFMFKP